VHRDGLVALLVGQLLQRAERADPRRCSPDVQPAQLSPGAPHGVRDRSWSALSAWIASARRRRSRCARRPARRVLPTRYVIATSAPSSASRAAIAAPMPLPRAGDQRNLSVQRCHQLLPHFCSETRKVCGRRVVASRSNLGLLQKGVSVANEDDAPSFDRQQALRRAMRCSGSHGLRGQLGERAHRRDGINAPSLYAASAARENLFHEAVALLRGAGGGVAAGPGVGQGGAGLGCCAIRRDRLHRAGQARHGCLICARRHHVHAEDRGGSGITSPKRRRASSAGLRERLDRATARGSCHQRWTPACWPATSRPSHRDVHPGQGRGQPGNCSPSPTRRCGLGPAGRGPSGVGGRSEPRPAASVQPVTEHFGERWRTADGRGSGRRLQEQRAEADGGGAACGGHHHADENCPEILDVPLMGDVLRSLGCTVQVDGGTVAITAPAKLCEEADYRSFRGCAPRCACGAAGGRCRRAVVPLPGGTRSAPGHGHARQRASQAGCAHEIQPWAGGRARGGLRGAQIWLDFPSVAPPKHPDGRRAGRGHHGDRQRRARAGDRRPVHDVGGRWAPRSTAAQLHAHRCTGWTAMQPTQHRVIGDRIVGATGVAAR